MNMLVVVLGNKPKIIMKCYCWQGVSANGNILNLTRGPYTCVPFDYLFMSFWGKRGEVQGEGSSFKYDNLIKLDWMLATTDGQRPQTPKSYFLFVDWLMVKSRCPALLSSRPRPPISIDFVSQENIHYDHLISSLSAMDDPYCQYLSLCLFVMDSLCLCEAAGNAVRPNILYMVDEKGPITTLSESGKFFFHWRIFQYDRWRLFGCLVMPWLTVHLSDSDGCQATCVEWLIASRKII